MTIDYSVFQLGDVSESVETLIDGREKFLESLSADQPEVSVGSDSVSETMYIGESNIRNEALLNFYRDRYFSSRDGSVDSVSDGSGWEWISGVNKLVDEMNTCLVSIESDITRVDEEEKTMVRELLGLDEHSSKLLSEQEALERQVMELESKMTAIRALKDVNEDVNNRDIIVRK
jgi:hypothetical protein